MQELYTEGVAIHGDPESCTSSRKGDGEALTGARTGGVLSREMVEPRLPTPFNKAEGHMSRRASASVCPNTSAVEDLQHVPNLLAREPGDPSLARVSWTRGPHREGQGRNPMTYKVGKSDEIVVSTKQPNDGSSVPEEVVDRRISAKGNADKPTARRTQSRDERAPDGLARVQAAARKDKDERFTALLHHLTVERLADAFHALKRVASPGVDGVTWHEYANGHEAKLRDLLLARDVADGSAANHEHAA